MRRKRGEIELFFVSSCLMCDDERKTIYQNEILPCHFFLFLPVRRLLSHGWFSASFPIELRRDFLPVVNIDLINSYEDCRLNLVLVFLFSNHLDGHGTVLYEWSLSIIG